MTIISTTYDDIQTSLATLFPLKLELSDSIDIAANDEKALADGYCMQMNGGNNSNRELCDTYSLQRDFVITISKLVPGGHKSNSITDTTIKSLFEELHLLIKTISSNSSNRNLFATIDWISDGGIEKFNGESSQFLIIRATFRLEYFESLI